MGLSALESEFVEAEAVNSFRKNNMCLGSSEESSKVAGTALMDLRNTTITMNPNTPIITSNKILLEPTDHQTQRTLPKIDEGVVKLDEEAPKPSDYKEKPFWKYRFVLISLLVVNFALFAALSIMAPFFPIEASIKGINTTMSGLVFSAYSFIIFVISPPLGSLTGRIGAKAMLMVGITLAGVCNVLFGFLHYLDGRLLFFWSCMIVRIFEGIGAAAFTTASFTYIAAMFPDSVGSIMGILCVSIGAGLTSGPAAGGFLYDWGGYGLPFYFVGGLILLTLPLCLFIFPSNLCPRSKEKSKSAWKILTIRPVLIVTVVVSTISITWGFRFPTLEPHLREFHLSAKELGIFFLLFSGTYSVSCPVSGYIADRTGKNWIQMICGLLLSAVCLIFFGPSGITGLHNTLWLNILCQGVLGISTAVALTPTMKSMIRYAVEGGYPEGTVTYGLIGGLFGSFYSFGEVIGPALGAFLTDYYGFPLCCTVMAGMCVFTACTVFVYFQFIHHIPTEGRTPKPTPDS